MLALPLLAEKEGASAVPLVLAGLFPEVFCCVAGRLCGPRGCCSQGSAPWAPSPRCSYHPLDVDVPSAPQMLAKNQEAGAVWCLAE